jgi:hypothetical protein
LKFYDFTRIKDSVSCLTFASNNLGLDIVDGRCAATWRGGDNKSSVAINDNGWFDHATKEKGSIIDLVAAVKFNGNITLAQEFLGESLNLSPTAETKVHIEPNSRYESLIKAGYKEVKCYDYIDLSGKIKHQVVRMEHPDKRKEFMQRTPSGWGLKNTEPILYNLKGIVESSWVVVCEGEKDADTLIDFNIPATTACGGSKKWKTSYNNYFKDKSVVIMRDNDAAGKEHALLVASCLFGIAKQIQIVCPSPSKKGDVTDFVESGGTWDDLASMIACAPLVVETDFQERKEFSVDDAKQANQHDFRNFMPTRVQHGKTVKIEKEPIQINQLIENTHRRFLGFPKKIGEQMFDHDKDTGRIDFINSPSALFSWIGIKSKRKVDWSKGENMVTKDEFREGLLKVATRYESISHVPDWPPRSDVYYTHGALPPPDPDHQYFNRFADFFAPASEAYATLLKVFIISPIFYMPGVARPLWVIDSEDGTGTGKTNLVEMIASLYGNDTGRGGHPIRTNKQELKTNILDLVKRIVSSEGRQSRIFLVDNVTGKFSSPELADFITAWDISGKAPYGRGEETRPNNLTYAITANSATLDNDLSVRAHVIKVKRPKYSVTWRSEVISYIKAHRMHIFADIINMLESHSAFHTPPSTRYPEFETMIMQAVCADMDDYSRVIKTLIEDSAEANIEDEVAKVIEDEIRHNLREISTSPLFNPDEDSIFIRSEVLKIWFENNDLLESRSIVQTILNLAKIGLMENVDKKITRYPNNGPARRRGILWKPTFFKGDAVRIIGKINTKTVGEILNI